MLARREIAAEEVAEHEIAAEETKLEAEVEHQLQNVTRRDRPSCEDENRDRNGHQAHETARCQQQQQNQEHQKSQPVPIPSKSPRSTDS